MKFLRTIDGLINADRVDRIEEGEQIKPAGRTSRRANAPGKKNSTMKTSPAREASAARRRSIEHDDAL